MKQLSDFQKEVLRGKRCPYCKKQSEYIDSSIAFGRSFGMIYFCGDCWAWCGVHSGTNISLGRLANAELRHLKQLAHKSFDKIWKRKKMKRSAAYKWLSAELKIPPAYTHIGMFNPDTCKKVIELSKQFLIKSHGKRGKNRKGVV